MPNDSIETQWEQVKKLLFDFLQNNPKATWAQIRKGIGYTRSVMSLRHLCLRHDFNLTKLKEQVVGPTQLCEESKVEEQSTDPTTEDQLAYLRAENKLLSRQMDILRERLGARAEMDTILLESIKATAPWPKFVWTKSKTTPSVTAVAAFGDWHIGEVIDPEETEGYNIYNYEVARSRLFDIYMPAFLNYIDTQRKGYKIDNLVVTLLGDMVSGEIHDEFIRTNEFPPPVAAAKAGDLAAELISKLSQSFSNVRCECVTADNHGRLDRKKPCKQRGERNWNYVVYHIAETALAKHSSISFNRPKSIQYIMEVEGWRVLIEHGDNVRAWMGLPWYGWQRKKGREAWKRQQMGDRFDYMLVGHWHVPVRPFPEMFVNGCLAGASEYDGAAGRFANPSQTVFLIHKKHGVFNEVPFNLGENRRNDTVSP